MRSMAEQKVDARLVVKGLVHLLVLPRVLYRVKTVPCRLG